MPTYAVLGATGGMGSAILRCLLGAKNLPELTLHVMVRSKSKFLDMFPNIERNTGIQIFEGPILDTSILTKCLNGASVIFVCVATNAPGHKVEIARSTARQVILSLGQLPNKLHQPHLAPVVVINRSMGLATETRLPSAAAAGFFRFLAPSVLGDVAEACSLYQNAAKDSLLQYIIIDPPALQNPTGTEYTGYELFLKGPGSMSISYADAGAAFVEASQRQEEFLGKAVGIRATGKVPASYAGFLSFIARGLWVRLTPFL